LKQTKKLIDAIAPLAVISILLIPMLGIQPVRAGNYSIFLYPEADTYVWSSGSPSFAVENHGREQFLIVGKWPGFEMEGNITAYTLIRFNLDQIPSDANIKYAYLNLTLKEGGPARVLVRLVTSTWNEGDVTWNSKPNTAPLALPPDWSTRLPIIGPTPQPYSWDIVGFVRNWFTNRYSNYGVMITPAFENVYSHLVFYSNNTGGTLFDPLLEVNYESATPPPTRPTPTPPPADYTPPTVRIEINPTTDIRPETTVTIKATATDDVGLYSLELSVDGVHPFPPWYSAEIGVLTRDVTYSHTFGWGTHSVVAVAWDHNGNSKADTKQFQVAGAGQPPVVSVSVNPQEVFPNDNTQVEVTVTASDAEGIRKISVTVGPPPDFAATYPYTAPLPLSKTETFRFQNFQIPGVSIDARGMWCVVEVVDAEYHYVSERVWIYFIRPYQWDYGLPYHNPNRNSLCWDEMVDVFGYGELRGPGGWDWWWTILARTWKPIHNLMCRQGECFGVSVYSVWHSYHRTPVPDHLTHTGGDLPEIVKGGGTPPPNEETYDARAIERWQSSQISTEILPIYASQIEAELSREHRLRSFMAQQLPILRNNILNGVPGVLLMAQYRGLEEGLMECVGAHAVVPWYIRDLGDGRYQIYVYDCNREAASTTPLFDYENYEHYPYVVLDEDGFSWTQYGGEAWNDFIWYISFGDAIHSDYDLIDSRIAVTLVMLSIFGPVALSLPSLLGIPIPIPMAADGMPIQMCGLPLGKPHEIHLEGRDEGEYSLASIVGNAYYGITDKAASKGKKDILTLTEGEGIAGLSLRFRAGVADDAFTIGVALGPEDLYRGYELGNTTISENGDVEVYITEGGDSLVIINYGDNPISTTILLESAESTTQAREKLSIAPKERVTVTDDWKNLGKAPLKVSRESISKPTPKPSPVTTLFEPTTLIVAVVAVVAVVAAAAAFMKSRKPRKIEVKWRFCINCGAEVQAGVEYCPKCGAKQR